MTSTKELITTGSPLRLKNNQRVHRETLQLNSVVKKKRKSEWLFFTIIPNEGKQRRRAKKSSGDTVLVKFFRPYRLTSLKFLLITLSPGTHTEIYQILSTALVSFFFFIYLNTLLCHILHWLKLSYVVICRTKYKCKSDKNICRILHITELGFQPENIYLIVLYSVAFF